MATNKAKKLFKRKESIGKCSYPSLPQKLIQLPALKFIPMPCMSNLGKIKLWLKPIQCNKNQKHGQWPQLSLLNSNDHSSNNPSNSCYDLPGYNFIGNPYRSIAAQQPNGSHCRIGTVENNTNWSRPSWTFDSPFKFASRSTNEETWCAIPAELTYISSPAIMVCCINERDERAWIRYECSIIDPFDTKRQCMQFTRIIGVGDKLYAFSLQGALVVIEHVNSHLMITAISASRAVPSVSSRLFKEYFVEVNGEILLVFLIHRRSLENMDEIEVFRLCSVKLRWIKVEKLQGKTLFLDKCGTWANPDEVGCRGNCVYFRRYLDMSWWVYDMESHSISPATKDNARILQ